MINVLLLKSVTRTRPFFNPNAVNQLTCGHTDMHVTVTLNPNKPFNRLVSFKGILNNKTNPSSETLTTLSSPAKLAATIFAWLF